MEMKTDFSKVATTENGKVIFFPLLIQMIDMFLILSPFIYYHFQVSENEEMKNGTADVTQDNDYSIAIVTNQL